MLRTLFIITFMTLGFPLWANPFQEVVDLKKQPIVLKKQADKTLVVFWATWCKECKKKMTTVLPELHQNKSLNVLAISRDRSTKRISHFMKKNDIKIPVYLESTPTLSKTHKVFSVPHWAIYQKGDDGNWKFIASEGGFDQQKIDSLLQLGS